MKLTGLLLAGGLSSRMGQDKATLLIDGQPLWARQLALLRQLNLEAVVVSARTMPNWIPTDIEVWRDSPPSRGPLSGLAAALTSMKTSHLLALAVDLPRLTAEHFRKLLGLAETGRGVIPFNQGHFEPLAAIYPKQGAPLAEDALQRCDFSLQSFAAALKQQELISEYVVPPEERDLYRNLNKPEDLFDHSITA
jgi:molybdopterin-guanine dinucleotide biosynthesis protein A